jgi:hypothetical protein
MLISVVYLTQQIKTNTMNALLRVISQLEDKRENGTMTMTEEVLLLRLIEQAEYQISLL